LNAIESRSTILSPCGDGGKIGGGCEKREANLHERRGTPLERGGKKLKMKWLQGKNLPGWEDEIFFTYS